MLRRSVPAAAAVAPAAVAALALALTGCGNSSPSWMRLGAAAIYGNTRVSATQLSAQVANLNAGYLAVKNRVQLPYRPAAMPGLVLSWYLRFATVEEAAARAGIQITRGDAQRALIGEQRALNRNGETLIQAAVVSGLPPDLLPELGRWIAIQRELETTLDHGVAPTTPASQQELVAALGHQECLAAKSLNIMVNPQYGAYDYGSSGLSSQASVVQVPATLAAPAGLAGRARAASPAPHLTPNC